MKKVIISLVLVFILILGAVVASIIIFKNDDSGSTLSDKDRVKAIIVGFYDDLIISDNQQLSIDNPNKSDSLSNTLSDTFYESELAEGNKEWFESSYRSENSTWMTLMYNPIKDLASNLGEDFAKKIHTFTVEGSYETEYTFYVSFDLEKTKLTSNIAYKYSEAYLTNNPTAPTEFSYEQIIFEVNETGTDCKSVTIFNSRLEGEDKCVSFVNFGSHLDGDMFENFTLLSAQHADENTFSTTIGFVFMDFQFKNNQFYSSSTSPTELTDAVISELVDDYLITYSEIETRVNAGHNSKK